MEGEFQYLCIDGDLDKIKQLPNEHTVNTHADDERGFAWVCMSGDIYAIKFLLECATSTN